ncbi:GRAM domain-containing protein [Capnocytophaga canimorsus]|uniref:GRAM domain-containing protein n=1 Tax=Capnocytophaga canimorsus TaxID=28188 RepID=UPI0037D5C9DD
MTQSNSTSTQIVPTNYGELAISTLFLFVLLTCFFGILEYDSDLLNKAFLKDAAKQSFSVSFAFLIFKYAKKKNSEKVFLKSNENEFILQEGYAQYNENWLRLLSGKLFLTNKYLTFKSEKSLEINISLEEITQIDYKYILGFIPNGIKISTKDGNYIFSSNNQDFWRKTLKTNLKLKN